MLYKYSNGKGNYIACVQNFATGQMYAKWTELNMSILQPMHLPIAVALVYQYNLTYYTDIVSQNYKLFPKKRFTCERLAKTFLIS